jgi:hypothetical protein
VSALPQYSGELLVLHAFVVGWAISTVVLAALLLIVVVVQRVAAAIPRLRRRPFGRVAVPPAGAQPASPEPRLLPEYASAS